jgi:hypothetical protein
MVRASAGIRQAEANPPKERRTGAMRSPTAPVYKLYDGKLLVRIVNLNRKVA